MKIRQATVKDLDIIMRIYSRARQFMAENGNPTQWGDPLLGGNPLLGGEVYPKRELIEQDIAQGVFYVCEDGEKNKQYPLTEIAGVFAFILGDDPTYAYIEDGSWANDRPYGTIHRIASAGTVKGVAAECFAWCFNQIPNLRIDTHEDNKIMQHLVEKHGFVKCGRIYVQDGSPRIAYQKIK